ncbi:hypothetical protein [Bacillus toyonensis]|uniref:hypothetical protein n=1 Tax=Bacillus toyonensis TaxID=155322 RepID=UPI002E22031C|nr:hypothetical protein [Bacillus toyonensis]
MTINYERKVLELQTPGGLTNKTLVFVFPDEIGILTTFLHNDVQSSGLFIKEDIEEVLNGHKENNKLSYNICAVEIEKDVTKITDGLAEKAGLEPENCVVPTRDLYELILEWLEEKKHFNQTGELL